MYNIREFVIKPLKLCEYGKKRGFILRTKGRHRRYDDEMLRDLLLKSKPQVQKKTVLYARVSSTGQNLDLKRQTPLRALRSNQLETFA